MQSDLGLEYAEPMQLKTVLIGRWICIYSFLKMKPSQTANWKKRRGRVNFPPVTTKNANQRPSQPTHLMDLRKRLLLESSLWGYRLKIWKKQNTALKSYASLNQWCDSCAGFFLEEAKYESWMHLYRTDQWQSRDDRHTLMWMLRLKNPKLNPIHAS